MNTMASQLLAAADVTVGVVLLGASAVAWAVRRGSRVGPVMAIAGGCWFLGSVFPGLVFLHRGAMAHLHLSYPTGRLHRRPAATAVVAAYAAAVYEGFADAAWLTGGLAVLIAVVAVDTFVRTSGTARKAGRPALAAALVFAAVLALGTANARLGLEADLEVALAYDAALCAVAVWLTVDLLYGRWTDATIAELVTQLGGRGGNADLRAVLARTLGDPSLVIGYRVPGQEAYVDEAGRPLDVVAAGRVLTSVEDDGEPVAVLLHDPAVLEDGRLLDGAKAALRLTVANARMRAEARARFDRLAAARRRLVQTADEQRRVLAQQVSCGAERNLAEADRLLAELESAAVGEVRGEVGAIRAEVAAGRQELRSFAHGIRPRSLHDGGLGAALPELADRAGLPVSVTVGIDIGRLEPSLEAAAYFVCAEALTNVRKHARASCVSIECVQQGDGLTVRVADDGRGGADPGGSGLRGLADRVAALGGRLRVTERAAGGTVVEAGFPVKGGGALCE
ncbi:sensor histidine kinase [Streptomyces sp. NPDC056464]|uniref:sensor histidine kinase n=1 Tax=Streptomyces sp. NPDC056464 TaxID=3345828 RepID=UPI003685935E